MILRKFRTAAPQASPLIFAARHANKLAKPECHEIIIPNYDGRMSAKLWGDPKNPPLVAMHGWLDNANTWDKIAPHLAHKYQVCCVDFPGHGHSDHPAGRRSFASFAIDIKAVADWYAEQGWPKITLMGHSMGSNTSMLFAGTFPDVVERLVLVEAIGPLVIKRPEQAISQLASSAANIRAAPKKPRGYTTLDECLDRLLEGNKALTRDAAETLCERGVWIQKGKYQFRHDLRLKDMSPQRFTYEQVLAFMRNVKAPTLVLMYALRLCHVAGSGLNSQDETIVIAVEEQGKQGIYSHGPWTKSFVELDVGLEALRHGGTEVTFVEIDPGLHHLHLTNPETVLPHLKAFLDA